MLSKGQQLYRKILWFDNRLRFEIDFFDVLRPQREISVSGDNRYKSGRFYSEKCKRWIQHESGLELNFIKQLEELENVRFYFEQPVQIPYWRGKRKQTYTPDFGIYLSTGEFVLVEIKDLTSMLEDRVQTKVEALMEFCSGKGFGLLFFDGKHTFDKLLKIKSNRKLEKAIITALDNHIVLRKKQYMEIMNDCHSTHNELLKAIIKHNLKYKSFPLKLQYGNKNWIFRQVFVEKRNYDDLWNERFATFLK